ncbi:MAG TPA: hypothetical protein PK335_01215 [Draconibacterium sp.]|nr:hypothetical protein [Draconibacterium sp.]
MKLIVFLSWGVFFFQIPQQHKKETNLVYILFENNVDGMFKKVESNSDSSFYFTPKLNRGFWLGFQPIAET